MKKSPANITAHYFVAIALWQMLGIMSIVLPQLLVPYIAVFAVLLALLLVDKYSLPAPSNLSATLSTAGSYELGGEITFTLQLTPIAGSVIHNANVFWCSPDSRLVKFQKHRAKLSISTDSEGKHLSCSLSGQASTLGYETLHIVTFNTYSRLKFWHRRLDIPVKEVSYRINPALKKIPEDQFVRLISKQKLLYQGTRRLMRNRAADQFYSIRKYQYPDSLRHIDHKKTAKRGELMTRVYDTFHSQNLIIALDLGRALCGTVAGSAKRDYYISACLSIANSAFKSGDRVSFLGFSQSIHLSINKARNLEAFKLLFTGHNSLNAREEDSNYDLLSATIAKLTGQRSIVLILTDASKPYVQESLLASLKDLSARHIVVTFSLLDRNYVIDDLVLSSDPDNMNEEAFARILYAYWLDELANVFSRRLSSFGAGSISISENYWMSATQKLYSRMRSSLRI